MVMAWHLGRRTRESTDRFVTKIRHATTDGPLFDISTDGFQPYEGAIGAGLFDRANHSQIVKMFSHHVETGRERYSPARFVSVGKDAVTGMPDLDRASTSHIERKNGSLRVGWSLRSSLLFRAVEALRARPSPGTRNLASTGRHGHARPAAFGASGNACFGAWIARTRRALVARARWNRRGDWACGRRKGGWDASFEHTGRVGPTTA